MRPYNLPDYTRDSLIRYVEHRIAPGGFLCAVLSNDLFGALGKADESNSAAIVEICRFIYNELPNGCWGSEERVNSWLAGKE